MAMNKNQKLFLNMIMLITQKYRLDEIVIISREMKDRIALIDCGKIQGATRDGGSEKCLCQNAGSILSDERGKLKCYETVDKPVHASKIFLQFSESPLELLVKKKNRKKKRLSWDGLPLKHNSFFS